jgi:hypothetical protein
MRFHPFSISSAAPGDFCVRPFVIAFINSSLAGHALSCAYALPNLSCVAD